MGSLMALGGAGAEMQKSTRNNRSLAHRRKSLKEIHSENDSGKKQGNEYSFKEPSPEELAQLKRKIFRDRLIAGTIKVLVFITLTALAIAAIRYLT